MSRYFARKIVIFPLLIFTIFLAVIWSSPSDSSSTEVWVTDSMTRIFPGDRFKSEQNIQLYAAKGEYESFQIGIKLPSQSLYQDEETQATINFTDFYGSDENQFSKDNLELYQEKYVLVDQSSPHRMFDTNKPEPKKWYPDGLFPLGQPGKSGIQLYLGGDNNESQILWVDIFVPREAIADNYHNQFTISTNKEKIQGEIQLKVWDFELPTQPSLNSAFLLWNNQREADAIELLKHKIMPVLKLTPDQEKNLIDNWGLKSLRLPFWSGADVSNCDMRKAPSTQEIAEVLEERDPRLLNYVYSVDEIDRCTNLYEPLKRWGKNIHQAGAKHLAVMSPVPELYDYIDIWVVDPSQYLKHKKRIREVLARNKEVWFYTALVQDGYSPKWQIDFAPINYRIPHGFINQSLGLTGVLYWAADFWESDPWLKADYKQDGKYYPGEGQLVYPGKKFGINQVLPSMRLKIIRDGVEDYEYVEILKNHGLEDWSKQVLSKVAPNWKAWTQDPQKLALARIKLGENISALSTQVEKSKTLAKG